jgi:ribosomal 30S subunit maturation factor RimM
LLETGANDVLVVDRAAVPASADGAEVAAGDELIPFARQYVTAVDVAGGRITVNWDPD